MIPGYMLTDTVTLWNFVSDSPTSPSQYQKTVVKRVKYKETQGSTVVVGGKQVRDALVLYISLQESEPDAMRVFLEGRDFKTIVKIAPGDMTKFFTVQDGEDIITIGEVEDTTVPSGVKTYKPLTVEVKTMPDGRGFVKVIAV